MPYEMGGWRNVSNASKSTQLQAAEVAGADHSPLNEKPFIDASDTSLRQVPGASYHQ
jgi:hypothetical protein